MTTEQKGAPSATAGGAPAPDLSAIRDVVLDSLRAVPLWQFRQGLVTAGLIPADAEIQAAERKPVNGEPGIRMEWDEDVEAMRIDGIGWDLSFGCTVSFAYDHDKGEHYVCVSTSDADQRAGITSRRTTKEQLASFGQQLLNVFGEPDPRDAEIERLRRVLAEVEASRDRGFTRYADLLNPIRAVFGKSPVDASHYRELRDGITRLISSHSVEATRHEQTKAERDEARAEVSRLERCYDAVTARADSVEAERDEARAELDRLRQELDDVRSRAGRIEVDRSSKAVLLGRIRDILREADAKPAEPRIAEDRCGAGNEDYPELRCKLAAGHQNDHEDPDQGAAWSPEIATPAEPRRWRVGDPEPEIGTTVWRRAERYRRSSNGWHRVGDFTGYGSWAWILSVGSEVVEAVDRG